MLSNACEYALRAVLYLTPTSTYVPIRTVSEALGIPYSFLAKIVQPLTQQGLLTSARGPNGGVMLGRPATQITLEEIVVAIDGPSIFTDCVLGLPGCGERKPCPLHEQWAPARERVRHIFGHMSLAEMAERMAGGDYRLASLTAPEERAGEATEG